MHEIFIEAESFRKLGGWVVDQQSMQTLHSSYILAHGLGVPVADAVTEFSVDVPGEYYAWALTRDWTAARHGIGSLPETAFSKREHTRWPYTT